MKSLAQMVEEVLKLKAIDGLSSREEDFLRNVDNRTRMDRKLNQPLNLTAAQAEWVEGIWKKHFGRSS